MIPKIIHQMWLDKNYTDNHGPPSKYESYVDSIIENNQDFERIFWNMKKVKNLFDTNKNISKYKKIWKNMPNHIQKCDFARYAILYVYGGIYIDLDFLCFRNFSPLLDRELILVSEPEENYVSGVNPLCNGFIGSIVGHNFWIDWMDYISECCKKTKDVDYTTGTINFRIFFDSSKYSNTVLVDTCDILPFYISSGPHLSVSNKCIHRNNGLDTVTDRDYYKNFGNYVHTKWYEGSGWFQGDQLILKLADDKKYVSTNNLNKIYLWINQQNIDSKIFFVFILLLLTISLIIILFMVIIFGK